VGILPTKERLSTSLTAESLLNDSFGLIAGNVNEMESGGKKPQSKKYRAPHWLSLKKARDRFDHVLRCAFS
jgi:hypothetical protein